MSLTFLSLLLLVAAASAAKYIDCGDGGAGVIHHLHLNGCRTDAPECVIQYLRKMHLDLKYKIKERDVFNTSFRLTVLDSKQYPLLVVNFTNMGPVIERITAVTKWATPIMNLFRYILDNLFNTDFTFDYPLKAGKIYTTKFYFPAPAEIARELSPVTLRAELKDHERHKHVFCFEYKLAALRK